VKKLYVLTDKHLNREQKWVQATHAAIQYVIENPDTFENGTLVILESPDIEQDALLADTIFREPYYDNRITSAAKLTSGEEFKGYKLLRMGA